jgi:hypothetical protein
MQNRLPIVMPSNEIGWASGESSPLDTDSSHGKSMSKSERRFTKSACDLKLAIFGKSIRPTPRADFANRAR